MLRRLLKDSVIYSLATFLSRGISLLLIPFYTRALSPEAYGIIDMLTIFGTLATQVVTLQITQGLARFFADADEAQRRLYASSSLWFSLVMFGVFGAIAWAIAEPLSTQLLNAPGHADVFRLSLLAVIGNGLFYFFQNQLRYQLQPMRYAIASLLYTLVNAGVAFYAIVIAQSGVNGFFAAQVLGALLGMGVAWAYCRDLYGLVFSSKACQALLAYSFPLVPSSLFVVVTAYIDRIAIRTLMTVSDVGLYGIGFRLASVISLAMVGIQGALTPLIYARYREASTPGEIARLFRLFMAVCFPILLFIALFAREMLVILTGPEYHDAWPIMPFVATSSLLASLYIFAPGLDIAKKTKTIAGINLGSALVNTGLNFLLIPLLGIVGAALGTCISAFLMFMGYWYFGARHYRIPFDWSRLMAAGAILAVVTGFGIQSSSAAWGLKLGIWCLATMGVTAVLVKRPEVAQLFRRVRLEQVGAPPTN